MRFLGPLHRGVAILKGIGPLKMATASFVCLLKAKQKDGFCAMLRNSYSRTLVVLNLSVPIESELLLWRHLKGRDDAASELPRTVARKVGFLMSFSWQLGEVSGTASLSPLDVALAM